MSKENPELWAVRGDDNLFEDLDYAVDHFVENCGNDIPQTVVVVGYDRVKIDIEKEKENQCYDIIDCLIEYLDENYSSAGNDPTEVTNEMIKLTKEYIEKILQLYVPYNCVEVTSVVVPTIMIDGRE